MIAAQISSMELLVRYNGLMSRDDAREHLTSIVQPQVEEVVTGVDFSNFRCSAFTVPGETILGLREIELPDGAGTLPVIGMAAGSHYPLYFFLYLSESLQWKAYVPERGNAYNWDTREAFVDLNANVGFLERFASEFGIEPGDIFDLEALVDMMVDELAMAEEMQADLEVVPIHSAVEVLGGGLTGGMDA